MLLAIAAATGNLDPTNKEKVLDVLLQQASASGSTLVAVTHDHDLLERFERIIDFKDFYSDIAHQTPDISR